MTVVLVNMSVSLDGFAAGPHVSAQNPMGDGGPQLHEWLFAEEGGEPDGSDVGATVARHLRERTGAVVIGRRTYDVGVDLWQDTPYPVPTFVVTHEALPPRPMRSAGFTFVAGGVAEAVRQAGEAAGERDVLVMGGPTVARACIAAGLVDELQLQLVPVLLGSGTRLLDGLPQQRLHPADVARSPYMTNLRFTGVRREAPDHPVRTG